MWRSVRSSAYFVALEDVKISARHLYCFGNCHGITCQKKFLEPHSLGTYLDGALPVGGVETMEEADFPHTSNAKDPSCMDTWFRLEFFIL